LLESLLPGSVQSSLSSETKYHTDCNFRNTTAIFWG
jgi:hypothetical protein